MGDPGGGAYGIVRDGDAVRLGDADEVVGLEAGVVRFERGDDELVRVQWTVGDVEAPVVGSVQDGVVGEDELAGHPGDMTVVPELFGDGELVLVGGVVVVLAFPDTRQAQGQVGGEGVQVGAGWVPGGEG